MGERIEVMDVSERHFPSNRETIIRRLAPTFYKHKHTHTHTHTHLYWDNFQMILHIISSDLPLPVPIPSSMQFAHALISSN